MAEVSLVAVGFRMASIFIGLVLAGFVMLIYNRTRGGSKGWLSLTLMYASLGVWGFLQVVFQFALPVYVARVVFGTVLFLIIGFANPLTTILLSRDMQLDTPRWLNLRNYIIFVAVFFGVMLLYNFILTPFVDPLAELLTVSLLSVGVLFFLAFFGYLFMYRETGVRFWLILGLGTLMAAVGVFSVLGATDCCGLQAPLHTLDSCSTWIYDYADTLPTPCAEWLIPVLSNGVLLILVGELLSIYGLLKITLVTKA